MKMSAIIVLFLLTGSWCFLIILLSELAREEIKYDCSKITYPLAIDVPVKVKKLCKEK